ncbi:uncharacterized protein M421DRAFT_410848 [Didymella exigua CBS 183.55]|uniref:Uncharacterized protein n=1 Tax=Didymella exigua CBS 183.55 TaxID=1150837 RepID=A0A6A5RQT8_9PLEO|nr:uncharacterized protein M421DRAFT_410848 [Didymella exigua CBS 183.55]KAF1930705.1 hypothetical protein M421DRAFT_410848 [Didymella exigua CBS 183.55]
MVFSLSGIRSIPTRICCLQRGTLDIFFTVPDNLEKFLKQLFPDKSSGLRRLSLAQQFHGYLEMHALAPHLQGLLDNEQCHQLHLESLRFSSLGVKGMFEKLQTPPDLSMPAELRSCECKGADEFARDFGRRLKEDQTASPLRRLYAGRNEASSSLDDLMDWSEVLEIRGRLALDP